MGDSEVGSSDAEVEVVGSPTGGDDRIRGSRGRDRCVAERKQRCER